MRELNAVDLEDALTFLGQVLQDRGLYYEVVAIGGGGLLLTGLIVRPTKDLGLVARIDNGEFVIAKPLPNPLIEAIQEFEELK